MLSWLLKRQIHKLPGIEQTPAELIKTGSSKISCAIHKFLISIWNKEEWLNEWKKSIIVPIYKKGDKTDCNKYRGLPHFPTTYRILSNILLSRLISYAEKTIGDHKCGFHDNSSTIDHISSNRQYLEKKW
jgi:hypothetical protein